MTSTDRRLAAIEKQLGRIADTLADMESVFDTVTCDLDLRLADSARHLGRIAAAADRYAEQYLDDIDERAQERRRAWLRSAAEVDEGRAAVRTAQDEQGKPIPLTENPSKKIKRGGGLKW